MFCDIGKFKKYIGKKFLIISQKNEGFALDTSNHHKDGGDIILYQVEKGNANQIWTVDCMGHIMNAANPNCVLYTRETKDMGHVAITGLEENGAEPYGALARWTLTKAGEILCQSNPDQMINVCDGKMQNCATMIMWHKQAPTDLNDKWKIEVVGGFEVKTVYPDIGELKKFVDQRFVIRSKGNDKFVVDTAHMQKKPEGGEILMWEIDGRGNANQVFTVDKYGHIICADKPGEMMALVPNKCHQKAHISMVKLTKTGLMEAPLAGWYMNDTGEIVCQGNHDLILNVCDGVIKNGPALILWPRQKTDCKNDKWKIDRV